MWVSHLSPEPITGIIFHVTGFGPCPSVKTGMLRVGGEGHSRRIFAVNRLLIKREWHSLMVVVRRVLQPTVARGDAS